MSDSNNKFELSRLLLTGYINENTPMCVIFEIADAHNIKYSKKNIGDLNFIYYIIDSANNNTMPNVLNLNKKSDKITEFDSHEDIKNFNFNIFNLEQLQLIARYVNRYTKWPKSSLIEAYKYLIEFSICDDPLPLIPENFKVGLQTPENPKSVNACVLYKTCIFHGIHVTRQTTIEDMKTAIMLLRLSENELSDRIKSFIENEAKKEDMINIMLGNNITISYKEQYIDNKLPEKYSDKKQSGDTDSDDTCDYVPDCSTSYELLQKLYDPLNDVKTLQLAIEPTTADGSIALAAINYCIDISNVINPVLEYKNLKSTGRSNFIPVDRWMKKWHDINPSIFDLSVTFNPIFCQGYYDTNRLISMATFEGYSTTEFVGSTPYELMQLSYVSETFYFGTYPNMTSTETPISLDDIKDIPYGQLLCYGQMGNNLRPISVQELIDLFTNNDNFTDPFNDDAVFSASSITKLKNIMSSPVPYLKGKIISEETIRLRFELIDIITNLEMLFKNNDGPTRDLIQCYRSADYETKTKINQVLKNLLDLSMYMRGWLGQTYAYPIKRAPVPIELETQVAINVTNAISKYEQSVEALPNNIKLVINNLPLVKYRAGEYQPSNCEYEGITISDRINIVKQGDTGNNINSCIRMSSNWLAASSHKYLISIGNTSPFDIFNLRDIA